MDKFFFSSPYLLVLVIDLFSELMGQEVDRGNFKLHHRCKDPIITHLSFADDLFAS